MLVYIIQLLDNEKRLSIVLIQHKLSTDSDLSIHYSSVRHMIGMEVVINPRQTLCRS